MSSSRPAHGKKKQLAHKNIKFLNDEAAASFKKLEVIPFIYERGFCIEKRGWSIAYVQQIEALHWETFCHPRTEAILPWVYEFYANAKYMSEGKVFVRGQFIDISEEAINRYFDLDVSGPDEFEALKNKIGREEVVQLLCVSPADVWSTPLKYSLLANSFTREAKVWLLFINASVMPTRNLNLVSLERAAVIYAILKGVKVNVGRIISALLLQKIKEEKVRQLWFPTLITQLCRNVGMHVQDSDMSTKVGHHITRTVIAVNIKVSDEATLPKARKCRNPKSSTARQTAGTSSDGPSSPPADKHSILANLDYIKNVQRATILQFESRANLLHANQVKLMKKAKMKIDEEDLPLLHMFDKDGFLLGPDGKIVEPTDGVVDSPPGSIPSDADADVELSEEEDDDEE